MMRDYACDANVPHPEADALVKARGAEGWELVEVVPCEPANGVDYLTFVWERCNGQGQ